jgi:hypothetical protein
LTSAPVGSALEAVLSLKGLTGPHSSAVECG